MSISGVSVRFAGCGMIHSTAFLINWKSTGKQPPCPHELIFAGLSYPTWMVMQAPRRNEGGRYMSLIHVQNLTFAYDGSYDTVFENVSLMLDTDWKLGFTGRNGRGKTTFLNLLNGEI